MHSNTIPDTIITIASFAKSSLRRKTASVSLSAPTTFRHQLISLLPSCLCCFTDCRVAAGSVSALSHAPVGHRSHTRTEHHLREFGRQHHAGPRQSRALRRQGVLQGQAQHLCSNDAVLGAHQEERK